MTAATRRALLSVWDKTGIVPFARQLADLGFELVSTGGTFRTLKDAGLPVRYVTEVTGHPEVFDGRVKTLHPRVHGGILFRRDLPSHVAQAAEHDIAPFDVVAVNLYPFRQTVARPDVTFEDAIEQIDIGGPAMVRAAAKNHSSVWIVVSPDAYQAVADALLAPEATRDALARRRLALEAYQHTANYDAAIASWLSAQLDAQGASTDETPDPALPASFGGPLRRVSALRYGENPHQPAALYARDGQGDLAGAQILQGKAVSYNNLLDLDAAVGAVLEHADPTVVVVKHTNPCGVGRDRHSLLTAWQRAHAADPVSAFGGIVALNRPVDAAVAQELAGLFLEVVAAPAFDDEARAILARKTALRLVAFDDTRLDRGVMLRSTLFGTLAQVADPPIVTLPEAWRVVTDRAPTDDETVALRFLWAVCKHVKSNAIVVGDHERTWGVGAGQMSRVDSVGIAVGKAAALPPGAALASDAFFPFRDGLDRAAQAGVRAIIQPGGSKKDPEVIAAANEHGIAMVFTDHRHFRH